jgi:hypothetical protein
MFVVKDSRELAEASRARGKNSSVFGDVAPVTGRGGR